MNVEIARRLAEMRRDKGYSQEELAESLGLSRQAVSKWERAESSPDTGNLIALAKLYGITLDELLRVDDDIADDVKFEARDKTESTEAQARTAVEVASAAAQAAARAAAAAATAQAQSAEQAKAATQAASRAAAQVAAATQAQATEQAKAAEQGAVPPPPAGYQQQPYGQPAPSKKNGPWMTFPYPVLCVVVFLLSGFFFGVWHPAWVVFLTIPSYYWIAHIIENDPNYRK
ncbi:helix-turn-helix domain-containing protein [Gordonibacter sp.]|uniref:helix-turn-helix domain-containing protein n=1 Tax=Gordonibacter sp. TaxID=1968902 RepID=UPI002FC8154C